MRRTTLALVACVAPARAGAQVTERVAFDEAVRPVIADHPTVREAAAGVLGAQANALADRL